jgi:hypothetical protein
MCTITGMPLRFRLLDEDGTDLGSFATSTPDWRPGHRIHRGRGDVLEVVRLVEPELDDELAGYLIVKHA